MNFKKIVIILLIAFSFLPIQKIIAQISNTGFVSGNIWYSKDPFEEGDKIKIHTFVFNPDSRELSGTVVFFDKSILLGKKDFAVSGGTAKDIYIDWTVTAGDHTIFGQIQNAKFLISKDKYEETYISDNETEKSSRSVSKKIISNLKNKNTDTSLTSLSDIQKIIEDKTPNFISEPMASTTNALENVRENLSKSSDNKRDEVKNEIEAIDAQNNNILSLNDKTIGNTLTKPFKSVELFFLSLFSFVLNNKIIFYSILAIILFFILRFIWNLFF